MDIENIQQAEKHCVNCGNTYADERKTLTKEEVLEELRLCAVKHGEIAEWYRVMYAMPLFEKELFIKRTFFDLIDLIEPLDVEKAVSKIEYIRFCWFNQYKNLQLENFQHLADIIQLKYLIYNEACVLLRFGGEIFNF